jgi:hypothetical protein
MMAVGFERKGRGRDEMSNTGPGFTGEDTRDRETYERDRTRRLDRRRLVGYVVCIALWLLSAVPLARLSSDEGGGAGVAAVYLAAGLGIAVVSRAVYMRLTRRPFWSPWLFAIAAVLAIASYVLVTGGDEVVPLTHAYEMPTSE